MESKVSLRELVAHEVQRQTHCGDAVAARAAVAVLAGISAQLRYRSDAEPRVIRSAALGSLAKLFAQAADVAPAVPPPLERREHGGAPA